MPKYTVFITSDCNYISHIKRKEQDKSVMQLMQIPDNEKSHTFSLLHTALNQNVAKYKMGPNTRVTFYDAYQQDLQLSGKDFQGCTAQQVQSIKLEKI